VERVRVLGTREGSERSTTLSIQRAEHVRSPVETAEGVKDATNTVLRAEREAIRV
jgi:hypothetical protein